MNERKHLIVLSAAQIFQTENLLVSVDAFAGAVNYSRAYVLYCMLYEQYLGGDCISKYKNGDIETPEFCKHIRFALVKNADQLSDEVIKDCWNKMCEFSHKGRTEISAVAGFLKTHPEHIVICVSDTNALQQDYNIGQCNQLLEGEGGMPSNLHFVNSFEHHILGDKKSLLSEGLKQLQIEKKITQDDIGTITSLHGQMPATEALGEQGKANIKCSDIKTKAGDRVSLLLETLFKGQSDSREQQACNNAAATDDSNSFVADVQMSSEEARVI